MPKTSSGWYRAATDPVILWNGKNKRAVPDKSNIAIVRESRGRRTTIHKIHSAYHGQNHPKTSTRYQKTAILQQSSRTSKPGTSVSLSALLSMGATRTLPKRRK